MFGLLTNHLSTQMFDEFLEFGRMHVVWRTVRFDPSLFL